MLGLGMVAIDPLLRIVIGERDAIPIPGNKAKAVDSSPSGDEGKGTLGSFSDSNHRESLWRRFLDFVFEVRRDGIGRVLDQCLVRPDVDVQPHLFV